jgi:HK97 family phage major capsid protein
MNEPLHVTDPAAWVAGLMAAKRCLHGDARMDRDSGADDLAGQRTALLARLENPSESDDVDAIVAEAEALSTRIAERTASIERARQARARLLGETPPAGTPVTPAERGSGDPATGGARVEDRPVEVRAGQAFTESESFAQFRGRGATGTAQIVLPTALRALMDNSATSGGAFQNPARPADLPAVLQDRVPRVADLIDRRTTDSNTVEYVQDTSSVGIGGSGNAAETAEGALKPESTYTFVVVSEPVRTVAHWVNLTRQSVDDNSMLQGYVEGRLAYGLESRIDTQILNGNGTSPNLRGILNVTGVGTYTAGAGEAAVISVRRAITVAQLSEYAPDTVVLSPSDWERIELSTDSAGLFRVSPNAANSLAPRIWGLSVVPTTAMTALSFLVGAFRQGATLWERQGTTLLMTDSHASNFTSNILTLLAERRAALAVWRPKAFVKGTFSTGTA